MSRKDYVAIAAAIRDARVAPAAGPTWEGRVAPHMRAQARDVAHGPVLLHAVRLVNALTLYLGRDNPRFDSKRFEEAALPEEVRPCA